MQYDWNLVHTLMEIVEMAPSHPKLSALAAAAQAELEQMLIGEHPSQNQEE